MGLRLDCLLLALAGLLLKQQGQFALQVERPVFPATPSPGGEVKYVAKCAGSGAKPSLNPISAKVFVYSAPRTNALTPGRLWLGSQPNTLHRQ